MKRCFFIGHRETTADILPVLVDAVAKHIAECGVTAFIVGHYGGFDRLAAQAVIQAKQSHPAITLSLLIPYHPAERPVHLPDGFDDLYYPADMERVPRRLAILRANRYVVTHVDHLIAYVQHTPSHAYDLLQYAQTRPNIRVENIALKPILPTEVK